MAQLYPRTPAEGIIFNFEVGAAYQATAGYRTARLVVVPTGIDAYRSRFDAEGRRRVHAEWDVPDDAVLVGLIGRLDPMKEEPKFLQAAALVTERASPWRFVCGGTGLAEYSVELVAQSAEVSLDCRLICAGAWDDMPAVYGALDIASSSSSFGAGFPNVPAQVMACGALCAVTDVEDSALIVGSADIAVPPPAPRALADRSERVQQDICRVPVDDCSVFRRRVEDHFSLATLVERIVSALARFTESRPRQITSRQHSKYGRTSSIDITPMLCRSRNGVRVLGYDRPAAA